jgi:hypothetical protein
MTGTSRKKEKQMKAEVICSANQGDVVQLTPENPEEWHTLRCLRSLAPMLPMVGSALFLTSAPYTEPDVDSQRLADGTARKTPAFSSPELTIHEV